MYINFLKIQIMRQQYKNQISKMMKKISVSLLFILFSVMNILAQPAPPASPGGGGSYKVPIESAGILLLIAMTVIGFYNLKRRRKE